MSNDADDLNGASPDSGAEHGASTARDTAREPKSLVARIAQWGMAIVVVGAALNLGLAWQSIGNTASTALDNIAPGWLVLAALLGIAPWFFSAARIWMWARFLGRPIVFRDAFRVTAGTELTSSISPKAIGGAPAKVALMIDSGARPGHAASILMLDNMADIVFFTIVAPAIAFVTARWQVPEVEEVLLRVGDKLVGAAPWIAGLVALVGIAVLVLRRRAARSTARGGKIRRTLDQIRKDFVAAYALVGKRGKLRAVLAVSFTTGLWVCRASVATAVMFGLGQQVDPILFFLLQWVVFAMMVLVPTPGAALGAEASFAAVVDGFVAEGLLGVLTAGWRLFSFYLPLLFGVVIMPILSRPRGPARTL
jgi:hypothetical protein